MNSNINNNFKSHEKSELFSEPSGEAEATVSCAVADGTRVQKDSSNIA